MKFNPVLMQMQPRALDGPIKSIRQNVNIPRVWFRAFPEPEVCKQMTQFVKETDYTHYIVNSDDQIIYERAFDNVMHNAKKYDVFTAWGNMHFNENNIMSDIANVCYGHFKTINTNRWPERSDYPKWETINEVLSYSHIRQTSMATFFFSCFKREILDYYGISTYSNGHASDHHLSYRIQRDAKYTIWTHRDAFIRHLRKGWEALSVNWLVGNQKPEIIYELEPEQYNYDGEKEFKFEPLFVI